MAFRVLVLLRLIVVLFLFFQVFTTSGNTSVNSVIPSNLDVNLLESYRNSADEWLLNVNSKLQKLANTHAKLMWNFNTNMTHEAQQALKQFEAHRSRSSSSVCTEHSNWHIHFLSISQQRMMKRICSGIRLTQQQTKKLVDTKSRLQEIYSGAKINVDGKTYVGESDINRLMMESRNFSTLLNAWIGWHNTIGPASKELFQEMIKIENEGAKAAGYHDISQLWKDELEMDNIEQLVDALYEEIKPLYIQLYSFVRGRLAATDLSGTIKSDQPLPHHVFGNMWAQNWEPIFTRLEIELLLPNATISGQEATRILRNRYSSFSNLAEVAQDFFLSIGFPQLPPSFWTRSQFERPRDGRKTVCHGSATDFYSNEDVRLLMCGKINEDDFYVLHHEMGHVYYFLSYRNQPYLFRTGANSAFHEAIGETIILAAMTTANRKRLGFVSAQNLKNASEIVLEQNEIQNLLREALIKIPLLPFALSLETWRWQVMDGRIKPRNYNQAWWDLKMKFQGIRPPIKRTEADFDPAAKFHIISNTPYIRYFFSGILQVQFYQALCEANQQGPAFGKPLHKCDIYGSIAAGDRLRSMMSLGGSKHWSEALKVLTNGKYSQISAAPLMNYYKPLYHWLKRQNQKLDYPLY